MNISGHPILIVSGRVLKHCYFHSIQELELSQRTPAAVQIMSNLPTPNNGGPIYHFFWHAAHADLLALLLTKAGDVETNPGPTTLNKKIGFVISAINKYMSESRYP